MATTYNPKISIKKGGAGAVDGTIASTIMALVFWAFQQYSIPMPVGMESLIEIAVGILTSAGVIAVKRFVGNWLKNHNIDVLEAPAPTEKIAVEETPKGN
jgi:hypothetical protein